MGTRKIVFNAVSAKMGGAVNYLRTVAAQLHRRSLAAELIYWVPSSEAEGIRQLAPSARVIARDFAGGWPWERVRFDQIELRRFLREERVDTLFSTANLGMIQAPCHQVLLVRNAIYVSRVYLDVILPQKPLLTQMGEQARRALTLISAQSADVVMTPSETLRQELLPYLLGGRGERVVVNLYGVDVSRFASASGSRALLESARLLFTSLYGEHKNLATLLHALERLEARRVPVQLLTTADPRKAVERSRVQTRDAAHVDLLEARGRFVSPGTLRGGELDALYRQADLFVYPSVVESFGHPLVEAMAAGLPIVAADVPINRELCGEAAVYFPPFDADACAGQIEQLLKDAAKREAMVKQGRERAGRFTWSAHVDRLAALFGLAG
jgi:glycosyltransferase involved in cell wall biosynthesis